MSVDPRPGTARFGTSGTVSMEQPTNGLANVSGIIDLKLSPAQLAPYSQPALTSRLPTFDVTALQVELREKLDIIAQLRREIEVYKEENFKQAEYVKAFRRQIEESEKRVGSFDLLKGRSDVAITELQKQNRLAQVRNRACSSLLNSAARHRNTRERCYAGARARARDARAHAARGEGADRTGQEHEREAPGRAEHAARARARLRRQRAARARVRPRAHQGVHVLIVVLASLRAPSSRSLVTCRARLL